MNFSAVQGQGDVFGHYELGTIESSLNLNR